MIHSSIHQKKISTSGPIEEMEKWSLVTIRVRWRLRIHGRHRRPSLLAIGGAPRR
jgi:hypothetical protein